MVYNIAYESQEALKAVKEFGIVTYKSPIMNIVTIKSNYPKCFFEGIEGVTIIKRVEVGKKIKYKSDII